MENNFEQANSNNLPSVDYEMILNYCATDSNYFSIESRGHKHLRASRSSYGDNAIGFVQIQRVNSICSIKARITPEHRVTKKAYSVTIDIDEVKKVVINAKCHDCSASEGGCKHAVAFLFWLHRRSEEPSVTDVICYWKKSGLSLVGSSKKFITLSEMVPDSYVDPSTSETDFLNVVVESKVEDAILLNYHKNTSNVESLSLHQLYLNYCMEDENPTSQAFLQYGRQIMNNNICKTVEQLTVSQSKSFLWHEMRYGRVTASKMYEASRCRTAEGSLVQSIFGATALIDTPAMKRGRDLEELVRKEVAKKNGLYFKNCGLFLNPEYPFLGASPDGISQEYCLEIKCPTKFKNMDTYVKNGQITPKFKAQLQIQMYFCHRKKGLFVVADPEFEKNLKFIQIIEEYDECYCKNLITQVEAFWECYIYSVFNKS